MNKSAQQADRHYTETGHQIIHFIKKVGRNIYNDYRCEDCDFHTGNSYYKNHREWREEQISKNLMHQGL